MRYSSISFCPGSIPFCPCLIPFCPCSIPFCPIVSSRYAFLYIPFCPCFVPYRSMLYPDRLRCAPLRRGRVLFHPAIVTVPRFIIEQRSRKQMSFYISFIYLLHSYNDYTYNAHTGWCVFIYVLKFHQTHARKDIGNDLSKLCLYDIQENTIV